MYYHIWTIGCQMNTADSRRLASALERLGYTVAPDPAAADIYVLNTCVVRQSAEDKAWGRLNMLRGVKAQHPDKIVALMGCMVGVKTPKHLMDRLPWVDVFLPPSEPGPLLDFLYDRAHPDLGRRAENEARAIRDALQDGEITIPAHERGKLISAYVPVVYGCSHACSFCVIPFRRGVEHSRPTAEILNEARSLAAQGVKEITLLGQIVDRYGKDLDNGMTLAALLRRVHEIDGIERIRFLTSHPNWMTAELLDTVAELPKVCEHIEVPVQAGDDEVLENMRRGYTADQYRALVHTIRERIPGVAIHTDIIVGFPGETAEQFRRTYDLLAELELDKAHIARYSPRPKTVSQRKMPDDVPPEEKERRRKALDDLQAEIVGAINARSLGRTVEVLVEDRDEGKRRWRGRTRQNKLVFFEDMGEIDRRGTLAQVRITWTGPWSMLGEPVE
ncbi:MAG: tRNA (N6-isopentenyl adenosine(37)-C2)-methylthiotransferase MiaB [Anaerolineae bacterium]|nr:tRNA (N6-isopentenyl adenosine(37)-C2)-methylthiotransferase MiaB [Anaerolineae bacterium]